MHPELVVYRNAKSTKPVTVTMGYRIDRFTTVHLPLTGYLPFGLYLCIFAPPFVNSGCLFNIKDTYIGNGFFKDFDWETFNDRINYVSQPLYGPILLGVRYTYFSLDNPTGLTRNNIASDDKFVMRADDCKTVPANARGRDSIRIQSKNSYDDSVMVLDLSHMPEGCAT